MKKILIGLIFSLVLPFSVNAATYYVDATGGSVSSDSYDGLYQTYSTPNHGPWQTISKVNNWDFDPGDTILFKRGGKWEETLNPPSYGSSGNPITFTYYGSGNAPEIKGTNTHISGWSSYSGNIYYKGGFTNNPDGVYLDGEGYGKATNKDAVNSIDRWFYDSGASTIYIHSVGDPGSYYSSIEIPTRTYAVQLTSGRSYLKFDGIYFWSGITSGVYASGTYSYLDFVNCTFHGAGTYTIGMGGTADHITFDNCQIHGRNRARYNNVMEVGGPNFMNFVLKNSEISRGTHAGLMFQVNGFTIENNEFWSDGYGDNYFGRNIDIYGAQNGMVRYNTFRNAGYGNGIVAGGDQLIASNVDIYYNIFKNGEYQGLQIWKEAATYNSWNVRVWNNVIYGSKGVGVYILAGSDLGDGIELKNNIIFENDDTNHYQVRHLDPTTNKPDFANNCIYDSSTSNTVYDGTQPRTVAYMNENYDEWSDNIASNPGCVDPANDFHLASNSPCINNGTDVGLTLDFEGNAVPYDGVPDIGAYEYGSQPSNCTGICKPNPCNTYDNCMDGSGTCTSSYCCSGSCTDCGDTYCDFPVENCTSCPSDCDCSPQLCCNGVCTTPACSQNPDCGSDPCKIYTCSNQGTCQSSCSSQDKTSCKDDDNCCPAGCDEGNDNNCVALEDPVALYHFDENFGNIAGDSSGNGNDGTIYGANWTNDSVSGYALSFDGSDDYVEIDAADLTTKGPFTVSAWLKKTTSWTAQAMISRWSSSNQVFEFQTGSGSPGGLTFLARTSDASVFSATMDTAQLNQWYHIVGVADGNTASLYVNGTEYSGSDMGWNAGEPSGLVLRIGMRPDGNYPFEGLVDEIRIYNRTLTPEEILELYNNPGGEQTPGDLNNDGSVNIFDLDIVAIHFGQTETHQDWNATADVVQNNEIDVFDVVFVASRFT